MGKFQNEDKIGYLFLGFSCLPVLEKGLGIGPGYTRTDEISRMTSQAKNGITSMGLDQVCN